MGVGRWYSKLVHRKITSFRNPIPRTYHSLSSPICYVTQPKCSAIQIPWKNHRLSPFVIGAARRYYCVVVTHSSPPGGGNWRWVLNHSISLFLILSWSALTIDSFRRMETVPFTNRTRLISWSHSKEKYIGQITFEKHKALFIGKTLPATHPESLRVRLIAKNIINDLQRVSGKEEKEVWIDVAYASDIPKPVEDNMSLFQKFTSFGNDFMSNKDMDVLDVKWVQNCRKKGEWKKPTTNHLKAYIWEILLVKDCSDYISAFAVPGGKIVVSSELLENFRSDDEIAAILGHEVAHILARHCAEKMTTYTWIERTICFLFGLGMHNFDKAKNESLAFLVEAEADYIGLLLMASAGYDPRVAPGVYKKLYEISGVGPGDPRYDDTGEKRARLLDEPKVMEEALLMYQDATRGCGD